jgi:hypothetical protein
VTTFEVTVLRKERRLYRVDAETADAAEAMALERVTLPVSVVIEDEFVQRLDSIQRHTLRVQPPAGDPGQDLDRFTPEGQER